MTCEWLANDLQWQFLLFSQNFEYSMTWIRLTCEWIAVNDLWMDCSEWLAVNDLWMACSEWLVNGLQWMTCEWLAVNDLWMACEWLLNDLRMTYNDSFCFFHKNLNIRWLGYESLVNDLQWMTCEWLVNGLQMTCKWSVHTNSFSLWLTIAYNSCIVWTKTDIPFLLFGIPFTIFHTRIWSYCEGLCTLFGFTMLMFTTSSSTHKLSTFGIIASFAML